MKEQRFFGGDASAVAILDETDSGLDADAVGLASESIAEIGHQKMGLLIICHHDKLLEHNPPQFTHVVPGRIWKWRSRTR